MNEKNKNQKIQQENMLNHMTEICKLLHHERTILTMPSLVDSLEKRWIDLALHHTPTGVRVNDPESNIAARRTLARGLATVACIHTGKPENMVPLITRCSVDTWTTAEVATFEKICLSGMTMSQESMNLATIMLDGGWKPEKRGAESLMFIIDATLEQSRPSIFSKARDPFSSKIFNNGENDKKKEYTKTIVEKLGMVPKARMAHIGILFIQSMKREMTLSWLRELAQDKLSVKKALRVAICMDDPFILASLFKGLEIIGRPVEQDDLNNVSFGLSVSNEIKEIFSIDTNHKRMHSARVVNEYASWMGNS